MIAPESVMAVEWSVLAVAFIFLGLRMAVRITQRQTNLIWSEVWLLVGALWLLGLVVCDTITYQMDGMSEFHDAAGPELDKIRFASNYFFDAGLYFPKLSMLTIYFHLLPRQDRPLRLALYLTAAFTAGSFFVTLFCNTFWCGTDPSINWSMEPGSCKAYASYTLMRLNWSLCISTEVLLFILPFPLLRGLRESRRQELVGLVALFALGLVTLAVSAGRFATMMKLGNDISIYVWATVEFSVSQIIVASMALRPLVRRLWRSVSSRHGGDTSSRGLESRRISTAKAYTSRTAVRIKDPGSPGDEDDWGAGSQIELRPYDGAQHDATKAGNTSVITSEGRSDSAEMGVTPRGKRESGRHQVSWRGDSPA